MFQFKQFSVQQDQCAMKIGTDGVLLGAWAPISHNTISILDIGTGTGIIALMLAQRTNAEQIDALEIDEKAYEQAVDNFENSAWSDRLFCFHAGLDEFIDEPEDEYDLIVSNPPFYAEDYKTDNEQRDLARFQDALPFEDLLEAADLLLSENGIFALIIPFAVSAFAILMFRQAFQGLPQALIDAARLDGCTEMGIIFRILWPNIKPTLVTVAILSFIGSWNEVLWPLIVIRNEQLMTMPQLVTLFAVGGRADSQLGVKIAAAVMLALPVMIAFLFFQKHFIQSMASTGLKD